MDYSLVRCAILVLIAVLAAGEPKNVAKVEGQTGTSCDAMPYYDSDVDDAYHCVGAFDGIPSTTVVTNTWSYVGDPTSARLNVTFDKYYMISKARFMPLANPNERTFQQGVIHFEGGKSMQITFTKMTSSESYVWEEFDIVPEVYTKRASFECTGTPVESGARSTARNGFIEVEYLGVDPPFGFTTTTTTTASTAAAPTTTPSPSGNTQNTNNGGTGTDAATGAGRTTHCTSVLVIGTALLLWSSLRSR